MVTLGVLWLPILVATGIVFVASNLVWMVLPHHRSDMRRLPDEAAALEALGKQGLKPGLYRFPWAASMAEAKDPAYVEKLTRGPVGFLTVTPSRPFSMGPALGAWIAFVVIVTILVAYVAGRTLAPGAHYLAVFRVVGTVAILAYAAGNVPNAIWWGKPWSNVWKEVLDGVVYGLLTAGAFGWLWPR